MKRREVNMRKKLLALFLAVILCIFAVTGCQSIDKTSVYGEYLGMDIDECFEGLGLDPETDMEIVESAMNVARLNEPVNYLGKEFNVSLHYLPKKEGGSLFHGRLDHITYTREYKDVPDEVAAKETRELFKALFEKYGDSESPDAESMRAALESGKAAENSFLPDITLEWVLPEAAEKIDPEAVENLKAYLGDYLEEHPGDFEYKVTCTQDDSSGYYVFSVRHVFAFRRDDARLF